LVAERSIKPLFSLLGPMNAIRAKNLIKDYNSFRAVNNVDFEIQEGEYFGFLGPNGAGKTTVMHILYCFMPPSSGSVEVFGANVLTKQV
jgi:ABC-type multidrug transport system ATPase subunit